MGHLGLAARRAIAQRFLTVAAVCALAFSVGVLAAGPVFAAGAEQAIVFGYMRNASALAKDTSVNLLTWPGFDLSEASRLVRSGLAPLHISQLTLQEVSGNAVILAGRRSAVRPIAYREGPVSARIRATLGGTTVSSDLSSLLPGAERAVNAGLAPIYVIAAEVALVGLGVLLGIGFLKLERQSFELAILATRGARMAQLVEMQLGEAAIAAVIAFPISLLSAVGLALVARAAHGPALPGTLFPIRLTSGGVQVALGGVILGALALVVVSLPRLGNSVIQERRQLSRGERSIWARLPLEIVPLLLGAVALTELRRHHLGGSGTGLDLLALGAPTLP